MQVHPHVAFGLVFVDFQTWQYWQKAIDTAESVQGTVLSTLLLKELHEPSNQPSKQHTNQQTKHIFKEPEMSSLAARIVSIGTTLHSGLPRYQG